MANFVLLGPNYVDSTFVTVAFDGGGWERDAPFSLVRDPTLINAAVSRDCTLAATQSWIDLGQFRDIRGFAIPDMVSSRDCMVRLRAFSAQDPSGTALADTGWLDRYPVIYPAGSLAFEHPSWLDGRMIEEDRALFPMPVSYIWDTAVVARYWLLEIDDTTSDLGRVEVPRLILAPGAQPTINMIYGADIGYEPRTTVQESWGGAEYFDVQDGRRVVHFGIDYLPDDEALAVYLDMQKRMGINGQMYFAWDPDDTVHKHRRSFLGRLRQLSPLQAATVGRMKLTFEFAEIIG